MMIYPCFQFPFDSYFNVFSAFIAVVPFLIVTCIGWHAVHGICLCISCSWKQLICNLYEVFVFTKLASRRGFTITCILNVISCCHNLPHKNNLINVLSFRVWTFCSCSFIKWSNHHVCTLLAHFETRLVQLFCSSQKCLQSWKWTLLSKINTIL